MAGDAFDRVGDQGGLADARRGHVEQDFQDRAGYRALPALEGLVASQVVDLSRGGVVERREDSDDRRRRIVSITDAGRPSIEGWLGPGAAAWREALQPLTPAERHLVVDTLRAYERAAGERASPAS